MQVIVGFVIAVVAAGGLVLLTHESSAPRTAPDSAAQTPESDGTALPSVPTSTANHRVRRVEDRVRSVVGRATEAQPVKQQVERWKTNAAATQRALIQAMNAGNEESVRAALEKLQAGNPKFP